MNYNESVTLPAWHIDFNTLSVPRKDLGRRFFIVAGPSGAGKSTLSVALSRVSEEFSVIPNCTTRVRRSSDPIGHFVYLTKEKFVNNYKKNKFFLGRSKPFTCYGYRAKDINYALGNNRLSLFMFRYSGVNYLINKIENLPIAFIDGNPEKILKHTKDTVEKHTVKKIEKGILENRQIYENLQKKSWPSIWIHNHFEGQEEIFEIVKSILFFKGSLSD